MQYHLEIQNPNQETEIPNRFLLQRWINTTLSNRIPKAEICIRIVDEKESAELNAQYRNKNKPTNVLSFPAEIPDGVKLENPPLGDLMICPPVVKQEANEQGKPFDDHFAHIVIHGVLHLLGYDHIDPDEAEIMETIEVNILHELGIANPYEYEHNDK